MPVNGESIFIVVLAGMFLVSIPLWIRFLRSTHNGGTGIERERPTESPLGLVDIGLFFLISNLFAGLGIAVCKLLFPVGSTEPVVGTTEATFFGSTGMLLGAFLAIGLICARHRQGLSLFGWQPRNFRKDVVLGVACFLMVIPTILAIHSLLSVWIPYEHRTMNAIQESDDWMLIVAFCFSAAIVAPIYEEFFYRATLQGWLQRFPARTNEDFSSLLFGGTGEPAKANDDQKPHQRGRGFQWIAIFITAALFGYMHWGQGAAPFSLFLFAIALGYLYCKTGSIVPCIVAHFLLNAMTLINLVIEKTTLS